MAALTAVASAQEPTWTRLINSDREPQNWLVYGGNYAAHRYSSLNQIKRENVGRLAPLFRKLAENIELCVFGLNLVKHDLERLQRQYYRGLQRAMEG